MDYTEYEKKHKKKRNIAIIISVAAVVAIALIILAIFDFGKTEYKINEISGYKNLPREPVKISVSYAPHTSPPRLEFELTDPAEIAQLTDVLFSVTYDKIVKKARGVGLSTELVFTDADGKEKTVSTFIINSLFIYSADLGDLSDTLDELAVRHGLTIEK